LGGRETALQIPEIKLKPFAETAEAREALGFRFAAEKVGRRHKIGGQPTWLQAPAIPNCESCQQPMSFYGQLDSIGDRIVLADCGIVYVFVCFGCFTSQSVLQSA